MSRALKQQLHVRGANTRLQLREALAELGARELQAQSVSFKLVGRAALVGQA